MYVLKNFSYVSYKNIRVQADIEATFDDVVVDFANPEYLDLDHTKAYVEPNEEGLNALFAEVKIIKVFDIEKTIVSPVYLIIFRHDCLYIVYMVFRRVEISKSYQWAGITK